MKKTIMVIAAVLTVLLAAGIASAAGTLSVAQITVVPLSQSIPIGSTGAYTVTLTSGAPGDLYWDTQSADIDGSLDGAVPGQTGSVSTSSGTSIHTLSITPKSGATVGLPYDIYLWHTQGGSTHIYASATAAVIPIPEVSTVALTSMGLIGLLGLVRLQRKH